MPNSIKLIAVRAFNGCHSLTTITIKAGVDLDSDYTLPTPSKIGYAFNGWYTTQDTSGTRVTAISADAYTEDTTYYAVFTKN